MNAMDRPGVTAPCRTFQISTPHGRGSTGGTLQIEPRRAGDLPRPPPVHVNLVDPGLYPLGSRGSTPPERPAFRSELWDPKAAARPVWGPQVRFTRTIQPIFRCGFTPPRDRARQAPRSAQRAAATGTQPCISKRALGPQSGLKAGLGSPGSLDENNSGDFRVWIHTSSKLRSSTRIDIRKPHATDTA